MTSGIYCIANLKNHKKYIGQSVNIESRIKTHFRELASNKHVNQIMQNSYNKNSSYFVWGIVEEIDSKTPFLSEILTQRETFHIESIKYEKRFNIAIPQKCSRLSRIYMPIYQCDISGNIIKKHKTCIDAAVYIQKTEDYAKYISATQKFKKLYGYRWAREKDINKKYNCIKNKKTQIIWKVDIDTNNIDTANGKKDAMRKWNLTKTQLARRIDSCVCGNGLDVIRTSPDLVFMISNRNSIAKNINSRFLNKNCSGELSDVYDYGSVLSSMIEQYRDLEEQISDIVTIQFITHVDENILKHFACNNDAIVL